MPRATIRDVPDEVRDELAARAAHAGQSMQEYLRSMRMDAASRPPVQDVVARARTRVRAAGTSVPRDEILVARDAARR